MQKKTEDQENKAGCMFCVSGAPFDTLVDGKAEIARLVPMPAIDLTTGETEKTAGKPFFAIWMRSDDYGEDFVPIEFCPKCGRKLEDKW